MTIDVEVELEDAQLRRLLFSNRWKDRGDAEQLADSISAAIRAALPEARESTAPGAGLRSAAYALTTLQLREYMARHREHTRRAADFSRRVAAGEFLGEPAPEAAEDGRNVDIRFKDGRFDRVLINPEWGEKTTAAAIVDAVLAAFDGVALVSESPAAEELAALAGERARLQEFVGGCQVNDAYNAARAIEQTCDDLIESYGDLAQIGKNMFDTIKSTVGQIKQYKYTMFYGQSNYTTVEYRDDKYAWWERALIHIGGASITEEIVDHPDQDQALAALEEAQGITEGAEEKYGMDAQHMRDSVKSIADHMSGWVDVSSQVARLIFPSTASQVPTAGDADGWRSPSAFQTYGDNLGIQHDAHETTSTSIETMLTRNGSFVEKLGTHLQNFAQLQLDQEGYYTGILGQDWLPEKWSITSIISLAGQIGDQVVEYRQHHIDQIEAVVETLNSAVTDILKTEEQRNAINRLSEPSGQGSVGWPDPAQLSARKAEGSTSFGDLKFQVQYFKDHITFWSDLSEDFSGPVGTAESTPPIDTMFHEFPGFMATTASGLNSLAGHIKDKALQRGQNATAKMSEILDLTIRTYLEGEEINTQQALELEKMLDE